MLMFLSTSFVSPTCAFALPEGPEGLPAVTQSELGKSVREQIVQSAKVVDRLDLEWERFSDSLRDEAKCDTRTNRRMFDNGFRRDGTRIGNPVLGALCTPEPLRELDDATSRLVLESGGAAASTTWKVDAPTVDKRLRQTRELVAPSFDRALYSSTSPINGSDETTQLRKRQEFNRDLYTAMRAFGDGFNQNQEQEQSNTAAIRYDLNWGDRMLTNLAPGASRDDYSSPFPKPDEVENQPYDEGALLDALGSISVALQKLQQGGLIGHWEISIPEDDDWNVVTIAVDDDISIGGQILGRERKQPLTGSAVIAIVRSAMESQAKISYKLDTFFVDPSTTKQELYDPTQLLLSLSDLGQ